MTEWPGGTEIGYYHVCLRKLWLFLHHIQCEQNSDLVAQGKLLHENSYQRQIKELELGPIKIDVFDRKNGVIHEVKKSKAMEESHVWQLKYYLYYFEKVLHIKVRGILKYPLLKKTVDVELSDSDREHLGHVMIDIASLKKSPTVPRVIDKPFCKTCSYYDFCYGDL
jgi:CRISPR-associated exonuclease Cas4